VLDDSELGVIFNSAPNMVWLDNNRLLVSSSKMGKSWILGGDRIDQVLHSGAGIGFSQAKVRPDGTLLLISDDKLLTFDPVSGKTSTILDSVSALSVDGKYAVQSHQIPSGTVVKVFDTSSGKMLWDNRFDGSIMPFLVRSDQSFVLLRSSGDGMRRGVEVLRVDSSGENQRTVAQIDIYNEVAPIASNDAIFVEGDGEILQYSLNDGARISLLSVLSLPATTNALAMSADGHLIVASESRERFFRLPVTPSGWVERACSLAGRTLRTADFANVLETTERLKPGCGDELPSL